MFIRDIFYAIKSRVVNNEMRYRKVAWGLARGCYLPINLQGQLRIWIGIYEIEIARYIKALVENVNTCFDIGASYGYYTVALARLSRMGKIIAIEPSSEAFQLLQETISKNAHLSAAFELHKVMFGIESTGVILTMDDFALNIKDIVPNFIKIDVDGPEYNILQGAHHVIEKYRPRFVIEVHSYQLEANCIRFLAERDYIYKIIDRQHVWPEFRPIELNRWVIAVHRQDEKVEWLRRRK